LFAGGNNSNGLQGRGNTTNVLGCTQVPGITNAKFVATDPTGVSSVALVRTDNTLSFAGLNRAGRHGYTPNASAVANTSFVTPSYTWQGYVAEVIHGYNSTLVRTADGIVYAAGDQTNTGAGRSSTSIWTDNNRFKELAIPNSVIGMRGFNDNSSNGDSYLLITNLGSLYGFGSSNFPNKYSDAITLAYSPMRVPFWGDTGVEPLANLPMAADVVGTFTGATPSSVTSIVDGVNNQTVTFTVAYTGGSFGSVSVAGSTVAGADITQVSLSTSSVIVQNGSGTFTMSFIIDAADIPALVPPNTQPQDYVLTLMVNGA
jgi:alpha-tubulin suppressor-like RCC1 family protein